MKTVYHKMTENAIPSMNSEEKNGAQLFGDKDRERANH